MLTQDTLEWKELVAYFQLDKISSDILAISSMLDIKSNEGWGGDMGYIHHNLHILVSHDQIKNP